jgi:hypothetical protein
MWRCWRISDPHPTHVRVAICDVAIRASAWLSRFLLWTTISREEFTMLESGDAWRMRQPQQWKTPRIAPHPIELWRLHGAKLEVRCLAMETSFGYAFGLELDTELLLKFLQPNLECLIAYADRFEAALLEQGWQPIDESH